MDDILIKCSCCKHFNNALGLSRYDGSLMSLSEPADLLWIRSTKLSFSSCYLSSNYLFDPFEPWFLAVFSNPRLDLTPCCFPLPLQSLLKRQGEMENGTVWSNSSESSDDSSSPALAHQRLTASSALQAAPTSQLSLALHSSSVSTPSLSSNQEEDETEGGEVFTLAEAAVPNGHLQTSCSHSPGAAESVSDCVATDRTSVQSEDVSETSCPDSVAPALLVEGDGDSQDEPCEASADSQQAEAETGEHPAGAAEEHQEEENKAYQSVQELKQPEEAPAVSRNSTQHVHVTLHVLKLLSILLRFLSPLQPVSIRKWRRPSRVSTSSTTPIWTRAMKRMTDSGRRTREKKKSREEHEKMKRNQTIQ